MGSMQAELMVIGLLRSIPLTRKTVNTVDKVTGTNILIEDCSVSALESVLLAILMAEMINLK